MSYKHFMHVCMEFTHMPKKLYMPKYLQIEEPTVDSFGPVNFIQLNKQTIASVKA